MDAVARKKVGIITKYAVEKFDNGDWLMLGQMTNQGAIVSEHPRLFRAMSFGDDDYSYAAAEVVNAIFEAAEDSIDEVVDHFDVDVWYRQKSPEKAERIFGGPNGKPARFWKPGLLRVFLSHLASNRVKVSQLKEHLESWGVSAFVAHEDIEPTTEWQSEIEAALASMDVMVAVLEPKFRDSAWTDQEIGFALGRGIAVIPLRVGQDPHGFIGKIQGVQAKGLLPARVAQELVGVLLRKPRHRSKILQGLSGALAERTSEQRVTTLRELAQTLSDQEMKGLLERSGLTDSDRQELVDLIVATSAFQQPPTREGQDDDLPF